MSVPWARDWRGMKTLWHPGTQPFHQSSSWSHWNWTMGFFSSSLRAPDGTSLPDGDRSVVQVIRSRFVSALTFIVPSLPLALTPPRSMVTTKESNGKPSQIYLHLSSCMLAPSRRNPSTEIQTSVAHPIRPCATSKRPVLGQRLELTQMR